MKKEQLLEFIPGPEETMKTTHGIAKSAKINDYCCHALLMELETLKRPLVKKNEFGGKKRRYRYWKKTKIDKDSIDRILKINPIDRSTDEHILIATDKYWGKWHDYIVDINKELQK